MTNNSTTHQDDWMQSHWRPLMGIMYMIVCLFDFVIGPVLWSTAQVLTVGEITSNWSPLTLESAGIFHVAMGAVLGVTAYGRSQEKYAKIKSKDI